MNDLTATGQVLDKNCLNISFTNTDGKVVNATLDDNNVADLTNMGAAQPAPPIDYLASGTVLYSGGNKSLPYGQTITLKGVTGNFENIEKGITINIGDKSTAYKSGLIIKLDYYVQMTGFTFDDGTKPPITIAKDKLNSSAEVKEINDKGITLKSKTGDGLLSADVATKNLILDITPVNGGQLTFSSDSRIVTSSNGTVDWTLGDIIVT